MPGKDSTQPQARVTRPYQRALILAVVLGLILVPAILAATTWVIAHQFSAERELRVVVDRTYEERAQLQTVFSLLQDAETGQRGYIITGNPAYLQPLDDAERQIGPAMARLKTLQSNHTAVTYPNKAALIAQLEALTHRRMVTARAIAMLRDSQGAEAAQARISSGRGKAMMDQIRSIVAQMGAQDRLALDRRVAEAATASARTEAVIIAMFVTLALLLAAAYGLVLRQAHGRQKLLQRAQTAAARQSAIFESAYDGMIIFNPSGAIESVNRAAEEMFGHDHDSLQRRDIGLLLELPDDKRLFFERLAPGQDLALGMTREFRGKRKDGADLAIEATLVLISLPEGDRVVAAMRDVSERRRVETMKSEFVSTVSHELRTPLTSIAGSLGLLLGGAAGAMPDKATRLLGIAHSNCQRLVRLINDLLDIEKIQSGKMTFQMEPQDLGDLARRGVEAIASIVADNQVQLKLDVEPNLPKTMGDADRLAQVISNLLSNALKYSPPNQTVEITVRTSGPGRLQLRVRDHGPGIPEEFKKRIFSKFAQADSSDTRQKGGTGLGLSISREISERHGGALTFISPPGEGATFIVELPAMAGASVSQAPIAHGMVRGPRVLMCEDDADIAEVLSETLRADGVAVEVAGSIAAAEAALSRPHDYAALLLDIRLPDGSGLDLLEWLRRRPATHPLPVMIISAEAGVGHALDVLDWIQKPVDPSRLRHAIALALAANPGRHIRVLHVEDDPDVRQIVADALEPDCTVTSAESLAAARKALLVGAPDLVILDLGLGDGSGAELLPQLHYADGARIPVVIFSAQSLDDRALAASVDAVLTKSRMSLSELSRAVRGLARQGEPDLATGTD